MKGVILASASPRRRELLSQIGLEFEVMASSAEEVITKREPAQVVEELSRQKAEDVASQVDEGIVIGADTVVCHDGMIMGKPKDREEAAEMIRRIQETYTRSSPESPYSERMRRPCRQIRFPVRQKSGSIR